MRYLWLHIPDRVRYYLSVATLFLVTLLSQAFFAPAVFAGCGTLDLGACIDDAQYNFWYGGASFLWTSIDAPLLQAAYLIDVFRNWLVATAFTTAYQVLVNLIDPLIVPFAVIAIIIGYILFAMMPLFGRIQLMNLRHVMTWVLMAPLLFTLSGQMIAQVEQIRVDLGNTIFTQVSAIAPGAIFGVSADDMASPKQLYDGNPCGTGVLVRPGGGIGSVRRMDELAAAMFWANAQDIHCPQVDGDGKDLPDAFYLDPPDGPKYASKGKVGDMNLAADRQAAVNNIQRGFNRLALGILPCLLAVAESLIQLLFALALITLWVGLPFALAFIFFEDSSGSVVILFRQGFGVLKTSWFSSFLLAVIFAALKSSAEQGNATAYTAVALLAFLLMLFLSFVGFKTVMGSIQALNNAMLAGVGVRITEPAEAVGKVAVGAATGGAALIATATAGYAQTGSGRYAAGAALGHITPIANIGEVAASMGWVQDEELLTGLYAGQRSLRGGRTMRMQMQADAKRTNVDGLTFREVAQERQIARSVDAARRDTWREINEGAVAVSGAVVGGYHFQRDRMFEAVGDRWHWIKSAPGVFRDEVKERVQNAPIRHPITDMVHVPAAAIAVAHDRITPDQRYHAYSLDERGTLRSEQPHKGDNLPADAMTVANAHVNITRLLRQGYTVQQNKDKTVTFWNHDPEKAATARISPNQECERLVKTKAVTEEGMRHAFGQERSEQSLDLSSEGSPSAAPPAPEPGAGGADRTRKNAAQQRQKRQDDAE